MTDYSKNTNFTAKDALSSGDPDKLIVGADFDSEFDEIATASATKANKVESPTNGNALKMDGNGDLVDAGYLESTLHRSGVFNAESEGASIASATDCNIWANSDGNTVHLTGTTPVTDWGTAPQAGASMTVICDAATPLTYNATTNDMNTGGANYTTEAGDKLVIYARSTSSYKVEVIPYDGESPVPVLDINGLTGETAVEPAADYLPVYDDSATANRKMLVNDVVGWNLLDTQTISTQATVDFTGLDGSYPEYVFEFENVVPATDQAILYCRVSVSTTFQTGTAKYGWVARESGYDASASVNGAGTTGDSSDAQIILCGNAATGVDRIGSSTGEGLSGRLTWYGLDSTTIRKKCVGEFSYDNATDELCISNCAGRYNTETDAIDGIRFYVDSGNLESGVIRMYGVRK